MVDALPVDVLRKILLNHVCAEDWFRVALSSSIFRDCFEKSNKWMTKATSTKATLEWSMRANPECRPGIGWCNSVAREGKLDCLILLRQYGCPWNESTCADAAEEGHLEVLQWARQNGCPEQQ